MKNEKMETRKDEVRFTTSDPYQMQGMFLAERLVRSWTEDFVDETTAEVVSIERNEIIMDRGVLLNNDNLAVINFHLQAGDIKAVTVSNQRRRAFLYQTNHLSPWFAAIKIDQKKKKFILYASSLEMVLEVVKDYVELNFEQPFFFVLAKEFDSCILLKDTLKKYEVDTKLDFDNLTAAVEEDENTAGKFYQIDVTVKNEEMSYPQTFVIETVDVDKAMVVIRDYINKKIAESDDKTQKVEIKLEGAKVIPCDIVIDKEFSFAYMTEPPKKTLRIETEYAPEPEPLNEKQVEAMGVRIDETVEPLPAKEVDQIPDNTPEPELVRPAWYDQIEHLLGRDLKPAEKVGLYDKIESGEFTIYGYTLAFVEGELVATAK